MSQSKRSGGLILLVILFLLLILIFPMFRFGLAHIFGVHIGSPFEGIHVGSVMVLIPILAITFFWILVSVWVYNDAERNSMSGLLWGLLVFFGNLIALIIYLIVRSGSTGANPIVIPGSKACPSCNGPIQPDFVVCPHCGTSLKNTCPTCEKNVQSGWKHCPYCGENL